MLAAAAGLPETGQEGSNALLFKVNPRDLFLLGKCFGNVPVCHSGQSFALLEWVPVAVAETLFPLTLLVSV